MKKIRGKMQRQAAAVVSMSLIMSTPAMASGWMVNEKGWWFGTNAANTTWHANGWQWIDGNNDGVAECYYFDQNGYMIANGKTPDGYQVNADGQWVVNGAIQKKSSNTSTTPNEQNGSWIQNGSRWQWKNNDGSFRKNGWYWLDGNRDGVAECYYFDANGLMIANGNTPDGYTVNADGAWVSDNKVQTKKLTTGGGPGGGTTTSSAGTISSGGGGGGGSSSGGGGGSSSGSSSGTSSSSDSYMGKPGSGTANHPTTGNMGMMTSDEWAETEEAILAFKDANITSDMTDFEKEMKIIQWLAENCTYNKSVDRYDWTYATAYSCIIKGEAQCSGYADAFLQTAKLCGLTAKYVELPKSTHAIAAIKIDGNWYWIDETEADKESIGSFSPGSKFRSIAVGSTFIDCGAINMTDTQVGDMWSDPSTYSVKLNCTATKHGSQAAYNYFMYGFTPENKQEKTAKAIAEIEKTANTYKAAGKLLVEYTDAETTANQIYDYLKERIDRKDDDYSYCIVFSSKTEAKNAKNAICNKLNQKINNNCSGIIKNHENFGYTITDHGLDTKELGYVDGKFTYRSNDICYTINYIYNGYQIGTDSESVSKGTTVNYSIPDGFLYDRAAVEGNGSATVKEDSFTPYSNGVVINVTVKRPAKLNYTVNFVCGNSIISTDEGSAEAGSTVKYSLPTGWEFISAESSDEKSTIDGTAFTVNASGTVFTVYIRDINNMEDTTGKYTYILNYVYNGEVVSTSKRTATPNQTLHYGEYTDINGNQYVPISNCAGKDTYEVTITEDGQIVNIETTLIKASDETTTNETALTALANEELDAEAKAAASENADAKVETESTEAAVVKKAEAKTVTAETAAVEKEMAKNIEAETAAADAENATAKTEAVAEVTENAEEKTETAENVEVTAENTAAAVTESAGSDATEQRS